MHSTGHWLFLLSNARLARDGDTVTFVSLVV